jgi:hypothetical protein
MADSLKVLTDIWGQLTHSPAWLLVAAMTLAIGLTVKSIKLIPNRLIPLFTLPFSTAAYAFLGDRSQVNPSQPYPVVILGFYGFLLGFVSWAAHKLILKRLERFLPWLQPAIEDFDSAPPIPLADGSNTKPAEGK